MQHIDNFISGRYVPGRAGRYLEDVDPATGEVHALVADSGPEDVDDAVTAARAAMPEWSALPAGERARVLLRLADQIDANADRLARAESIDSGKPLALARAVDIPRAAANFRFFAHAGATFSSESHETDGVAINYTLRRPRGVAGCISPWNLPLYLFTWKIAPALSAGCSVVGKPSEVTPMTAFLLGELATLAGVPAGVLNVVHGAGTSAGAALVAHPDVPTITFTGSTQVGRWIAQTAGPMFKRLSLELGGKNPLILFDDVPIDEAVEAGVRAGFTNQGQICLCGSRILVHRSMYASFLAGLVHRVRALRVGDPLDEQTQQGALVSEAHRRKVLGYIELARELGGTVHCGGEAPPAHALPARCARGAFVLPTVISGLDPSCRVEQEEIFGPVVTVQPFLDEAHAVDLANGTPYGLAATVYTADLSRAHRLGARVEAGIVWVNCWMLRDLRTPFGGTRQSGVGREGGFEAMRFFTEPRNVCIRF